MKMYTRLLSLLLALLTVFPTLVSCNGDTMKETETISPAESVETTEITTAIEAEQEVYPDVKKNDYNEDFFLHIQNDSNYIEYHWVEESENDALSQAIFNRQQKVREYLGVEIIATKTLTSKQYVEPFQTAVKSKDGSVDSLLTHHYHGIDGFITGNYLSDFNSFSQIDLTADYWNTDIMEDVALEGQMFLGKSDFNILCTYVILFNKEMLDKYADAMEETVYEMVENYRWTLDEMISLAKLVYIDATGDGHTIDDTFGIIGEQDAAVCGFLLAGNVSMISPNEQGEYVLSVYNEFNKEKTTNIVEKLHQLAKSDCAWFWEWGNPNTIEFQSNRALMILSNTNRLPYYLNYDISFGVLPYPMYDENQKDVGYRSLQFGGFTCIPSYLSNREMVGDTLEVLSFYSEDVNVTFYEKLLGKQVADAPLDTRMLEIVWDGIGTDFAQTFYGAFIDTQIFHMMPLLTNKRSPQSVASFVAAKESSVNKKISKFLIQVKNRK